VVLGGGAVSYEQGTPVGIARDLRNVPRHFGLLIARLESNKEEKKKRTAKPLSSEYGTYKLVKARLFARMRSSVGWKVIVGPLWEGYHESRRCSRDNYPESYITEYTSIRR